MLDGRHDVVAQPVIDLHRHGGERVDPGNEQYVTRNIPKVVGGVTPASAWTLVRASRRVGATGSTRAMTVSPATTVSPAWIPEITSKCSCPA